MEPAIKNGQKVLVSGVPYFFSKPKIREIVAFKNKNQTLIKRIIRKNKDEYFLAGDNSRDSLDSKELGFIPKKYIIGKVIKILD